MKTKKLVIVGNSYFAEIAYEYFENDSDFKVVAFSVEESYRTGDSFNQLPLVPFEELGKLFDPKQHFVYVAATYTQLNRLRTRLSEEAKSQGFKLASYISSRAFIWPNVKIGEHCFIFEDNTIQPFVKIDNNVVLWSGNHIGHHSVIRQNSFISSHVVIAGLSDIGENSFLGVNSTISNNITVGKDNWIGPSVTLQKSSDPNSMFRSDLIEKSKVSTERFFKLKD